MPTATPIAAVDEITNLETAQAAFDELDQRLEQLLDLANQLEAGRDAVAEIAARIHEGCEANNLDAATMDSIDHLLNGMSAESFGSFSERIEDARDGAVTTREHLEAVYSDAAETVATTGVSGTFLEPAH